MRCASTGRPAPDMAAGAPGPPRAGLGPSGSPGRKGLWRSVIHTGSLWRARRHGAPAHPKLPITAFLPGLGLHLCAARGEPTPGAGRPQQSWFQKARAEAPGRSVGNGRESREGARGRGVRATAGSAQAAPGQRVRGARPCRGRRKWAREPGSDWLAGHVPQGAGANATAELGRGIRRGEGGRAAGTAARPLGTARRVRAGRPGGPSPGRGGSAPSASAGAGGRAGAGQPEAPPRPRRAGRPRPRAALRRGGRDEGGRGGDWPAARRRA